MIFVGQLNLLSWLWWLFVILLENILHLLGWALETFFFGTLPDIMQYFFAFQLVYVLILSTFYHFFVWATSNRELGAFRVMDHQDFLHADFTTDAATCAYCLRADQIAQDILPEPVYVDSRGFTRTTSSEVYDWENSPGINPRKITDTVNRNNGSGCLMPFNIPACRCEKHALYPHDIDIALPCRMLQTGSLHTLKSAFIDGVRPGKGVFTPFDCLGGGGTQKEQGVSVKRGIVAAVLNIPECVRITTHYVRFAGSLVRECEDPLIYSMFMMHTNKSHIPVLEFGTEYLGYYFAGLITWFCYRGFYPQIWFWKNYLRLVRYLYNLCRLRKQARTLTVRNSVRFIFRTRALRDQTLRLPTLDVETGQLRSTPLLSDYRLDRSLVKHFDRIQPPVITPGVIIETVPMSHGSGSSSESDGSQYPKTIASVVSSGTLPTGSSSSAVEHYIGDNVLDLASATSEETPIVVIAGIVEEALPIRYNEPYAPFIGQIYTSDAMPRPNCPNWKSKPRQLNKSLIKSAATAGRLSRLRQCVVAGEPLVEALERNGIAPLGRMLLPMDIADTVIACDHLNEEVTRKAIRDRHFISTEHVKYPDGMMPSMQKYAVIIGKKLAESYDGTNINQADFSAFLPKSWSKETKRQAYEQAVMAVVGDKEFAKLSKRNFRVKKDEVGKKAKGGRPRGIMAEQRICVTVLHAIAATQIEHAIKKSGLSDRTIKNANPDKINKRIAKLVGTNPKVMKVASADFGKYDSTMTVEMRANTEFVILNTFMDTIGLGEKSDFWEEARRLDRGKETLTFRTLFEEIRTTVFGRSSGDRFTSSGNFLINFTCKLAWLDKICHDGRADNNPAFSMSEIIDHLFKPLYNIPTQDWSERLYDFIAEGDDNQDYLGQKLILSLGWTWEQLFISQLDFYNSLHMFWEPAEDDMTVAQHSARGYRHPDERSEFISKHFVVTKSKNPRIVSFSKLTKNLDTAKVSFSSLSEDTNNIGHGAFMSARAINIACPLLYHFYSALCRFYTTHHDGNITIKQTDFWGKLMETWRKDHGAKDLEQFILDRRELTRGNDDDVRSYIASNYIGLPLDVQLRFEAQCQGELTWVQLGMIYHDLERCAFSVSAN
jgi:hypothetical protein